MATPTSDPDEGPIATYLRCNSRPPPPFEGMQRIDVNKSPQRAGVENSTRSDEDCYPRPPATAQVLEQILLHIYRLRVPGSRKVLR